ncbi:OLC1v1034700C1 [Oldenlandia corymbosa var. corymbosa]|uniref:OLC1v1034700C1 n=1 Tax=Oldenlandia corymbosa var. corymbosa TaxID=529605 RepID=A0AAV1CSX0_OLDCO|nr:OLC1v1034700C1 [Oldenlandia corymbosa var. corymbosa]
MRMMMKKEGRVLVNKPVVMVPDELMFEILSMFQGGGNRRRLSLEGRRDPNLGGAQSNSLFRNRLLPNLVLHRAEDIHDPTYLSSTLVRLTEPSTKDEEESRYLVLLRTDPDHGRRNGGRLTEVVNGLGMRIPVPVAYTCFPVPVSSTQRFHLGFDPATRMYKLLRYGIQHVGWLYRRMQVEIITLTTLMPPSSASVCTWRKLELDNNSSCGYISTTSVSTGDGFLWSELNDSLISFDLNKEKFKVIKLQDNVANMIRTHSLSFIRSMGCPAIRIVPEPARGSRYFTLFLFENDGSNIWMTHNVQWPPELGILDHIVDLGNLPTGEILLMNRVHINQERHESLYSYNHHTTRFHRFQVAEVLGYARDIVVRGSTSISAKISCLYDNGSLFLPLDDKLSSVSQERWACEVMETLPPRSDLCMNVPAMMLTRLKALLATSCLTVHCYLYDIVSSAGATWG